MMKCVEIPGKRQKSEVILCLVSVVKRVSKIRSRRRERKRPREKVACVLMIWKEKR